MAESSALMPRTIVHEALPIGRNGKGFYQAIAQLRPGDEISVAASDNLGGMDKTVECAMGAAERGFLVEMHVAARLFKKKDDLPRLLDKAMEAGVQSLLVVGGDNKNDPQLPYPTGLSVVEAIVSADYPELGMGIPGYPTGHPYISDKILAKDLCEKAAVLSDHSGHTFIETQVGFDPQTTLNWINSIREQGIILPLHLGLFGAVGPVKGLRAMKYMGGSKAFDMMGRMGIGIAELKAGEHIPKTIAAAQTLAEAQAANRQTLNIAKFVICTLNDMSGALKHYGPIYQASERLGPKKEL